MGGPKKHRSGANSVTAKSDRVVRNFFGLSSCVTKTHHFQKSGRTHVHSKKRQAAISPSEKLGSSRRLIKARDIQKVLRKKSQTAASKTRGNGHIYHALDCSKNEIRILKLSPGARDDPIECELIHTALDIALSYRAISYTWGGSSGKQSIILNGHGFLIGRNAFDVLQQLRSAFEPQNFWIDAICINQSDDSEKTHQVRNMRSIYSKASSVAVWLGKSQEESYLAFRMLRELYQLRGNKDFVIHLFKDATLTPAFISLAHLFARDFWNRIWVVQEIAVASRCMVHCGQDSVTWDELLEVSTTLFHLQGWNYYALKTSFNTLPAEITVNLAVGPCRVVLDPAAIDSSAPPIVRLANVVCYYQRNSCCADPRDKIYALLGIASAEKVLNPYYSSSVYDVYTKFVQQVIIETENLNILCHKIPKVNNFCLQSWTPDWWSEPTSLERALLPETGNSCSAAKGSRAKVLFIEKSKYSNVLRAKGFKFDELQACGNAACQISSPEDLLRHFDEWRSIFSATSELDIGEYRTFFNTISLGHILEKPLVMAFISSARCTISMTPNDKAFLKSWDNAIEKRISTINDAAIGAAENITAGILRTTMKGRIFFISSSGLMGMAPAEARMGDKICILLGCSTPVILRPSDDNKYYTLIGEAYIHEYMEGKGMDELDQGKHILQDFDLQ
jgi:hypothetical protein